MYYLYKIECCAEGLHVYRCISADVLDPKGTRRKTYVRMSNVAHATAAGGQTHVVPITC